MCFHKRKILCLKKSLRCAVKSAQSADESIKSLEALPSASNRLKPATIPPQRARYIKSPKIRNRFPHGGRVDFVLTFGEADLAPSFAPPSTMTFWWMEEPGQLHFAVESFDNG